MMSDNGGGGLFGDDVELFGQRDADAVGLEELEQFALLLQVGTGGVAETVAAAAIVLLEEFADVVGVFACDA